MLLSLKLKKNTKLQGEGEYSRNHHYFEWTEIRKLNGGGDWGEFSSRKHFFFWLCLIFPTEERFRENPDTSLEENKNFTALLSWRESSSLSIHSNWRTQFYHSKNLAFLQIKGKKVNWAFVKMHGIKNYFPFEFWNVIFFRMTNCSYRYTSCIAEDSKEINQFF